MAALSYRFGPFTLDSQTKLLFDRGQRLHLQPKTLDLLVILLERGGNVVSKDELLALVWPETCVEEGSVHKNVFLLRKTLGVDREGRPYIETIAKRGYRFAAKVDATNSPVPEPPECDVPRPAARPWAQVRRLALPALTTLLLGIVIAVFVLWRSGHAAGSPVRSILIVPFKDMGGNADSEVFSAGLTEELTEALTGVPDMRVTPGPAAQLVKRTPVDVREVARRFHVDAVLEGGVRWSPQSVHVDLRVVRASDLKTLFSATADRPTESTIQTQEELARAVLSGLHLPAPTGAERLIGTTKLDAYNTLIRGRFTGETEWDNGVLSALEKAFNLFKRAGELDPSYADAFAYQAWCLSGQARSGLKPRNEAYMAALDLANRAVKLRARSVTGHFVLGQIYLYHLHNFQTARKEFDLALAISPDDPGARYSSSMYWLVAGRPELAESEAQRALAADPFNFSLAVHLAWVHVLRERYSEAIKTAQPLVERHPAHTHAVLTLCTAHERAGRLPDAIALRRHLGAPEAVLKDMQASFARNGVAGYAGTLARYLQAGDKQPHADIAELYALAGERTLMYRNLDRAIDDNEESVLTVATDPAYAATVPSRSFKRYSIALGSTA